MAIDFTNMQSVQAMLAQYGINTENRPNINTNANFSDYLMQALDSSKETNDKKQTNELFSLLSGNATSSSMQSLLGLGNTSILTQYLQGSNANVSSMFGLNNPTSTEMESTTDMFSNYLQSNFSAKISSAMSAAKMKLQQNLDQFRANNDVNNPIVKQRIEQMEQNVSLVSKYLQPKPTESKQSTTEDQLLQLLQNNAAYNKYLMNLNP